MSDFEEHPDNSSENMKMNSDLSSFENIPSAELSQTVKDETRSAYDAQYYSPYDAPQYRNPSYRPYFQPGAYAQPPYQPAPYYSSYNSYPQQTGNYYPQQPGFVPPFYPPMISSHQSGEGIAVASMVLGILSLILFGVPFLDVILSLIALILGIIAKTKGNSGMAIAGIIMGIIGLLLSALIIVLFFTAIFSSSNASFNGYSGEWSNFSASLHIH